MNDTLKITAFLVALAASPNLSPTEASDTGNAFTGPYGGLDIGAVYGQRGQTKDTIVLSYSGNIGYRLKLSSRWRLGLEGTMTRTGTPEISDALKEISSTNLGALLPLPGEAGAFGRAPFIAKNRSKWSIAGTISYVFGKDQKNMVFAKAGITSQRRDLWQQSQCLEDSTCATSLSYEKVERTDKDLTVSIGYERLVSRNISIRLALDYDADRLSEDRRLNLIGNVGTISTKFGVAYNF